MVIDLHPVTVSTHMEVRSGASPFQVRAERRNCRPVFLAYSSCRGFNILELMIVVTVVGILAAIALPSFSYSIQNNRVKTAASDMHASLLYARSEAIKRNDNVVVTPIAGGWQITHGATILHTKNDLSGDVAVNCNTDSDVSLEACPASLTFSRTGRPNIFLELRFTSASNTVIPMRCVTLSLSGRPNVKTDKDSNADNGCT